MKRHSIALIIHPCKDALIPRNVLAKRLNDFAGNLIEASTAYKNVRFNLAMPAFYLEILDPLVLLQLREINKSGRLEWLFSGYTEPFLTFCPQWLLEENYKYGSRIFNELTGTLPSGLMLPYSNWEPSAMEVFRSCGIGYCIMSKALLPPEVRSYKGYWITEHLGATIALFPAHVVYATGVSKLIASLESLFNEDTRESSYARIICMDLLCPLDRQSDINAEITGMFKALDGMLLSYQSMGCTEFISSNFNLGLRYIPSGIVMKRDDENSEPDFMNDLNKYVQPGILRWKLADVAENIASRKETKLFETMKKDLFFVQDINRFLPSQNSGFLQTSDRLWSFAKLIDIERVIYERDKIKGGHIRIADYLKNGAKTIILTNDNISAYIDYKNGGRIFEIDYKSRNFNACSVITLKSKTGLSDHCLPVNADMNGFREKNLEIGDFVSGDFGYKIKKSPTGIKAVLNRNGTLLQGEKNCPLNMEKLIGLEKDHAAVSFVYQFSNQSLTPYAFRFAVECPIVMPGIKLGMARITHEKKIYSLQDKNSFSMTGITDWTLDDAGYGVRMIFNMRKPVDLWCFHAPAQYGCAAALDAVTLVINTNVEIEGGKSWTLMGDLVFRKLRIKRDIADEI
jgi:hypothetical protein